MNISPARKAAFSFLHDDAWLDAPDWDELVAEKMDTFELEARDRRLFSYLVSGVVRLRGRLDARLRRLCGRDSFHPAVLAALRLALFQMEEMDRQPAHAVFSESVEWVKRRERRLAGWTNAQLRSWQRGGVPGSDPSPDTDALAYAVDVLSYPEWLAKRWLAEFGAAKAFAIMAAMNEHEGACFRWNALRPGFDEFLARLRLDNEGCGVEHPSALPWAFRVAGAWPEAVHAALEGGDLSCQDESSQYAARLLLAPPKTKGPLVDLCAAPGGKSCQLAELCGDKRPVSAIDRSEARLGKVLANIERLGLNSIVPEEGDLLTMDPRPAEAVLLDAPCSALGVLAGNPDARWRKSEQQIAKLTSRQREMLAAATRWVAPGGRLLYSVCTITPEETVRQRFWFMHEFTGFRIEAIGKDELPERFILPEGDALILPESGGWAGTYLLRLRREAE